MIKTKPLGIAMAIACLASAVIVALYSLSLLPLSAIMIWMAWIILNVSITGA